MRPRSGQRRQGTRYTSTASATDEGRMRSWVFRNRRRLEVLLGRATAAAAAAPMDPPAALPEPARRARPRILVLQPVRRAPHRARD